MSETRTADRWLCAVVVAMTGCGRIGFDTDLVVLGEDASNVLRPLCTTPFEEADVFVSTRASTADPFSPGTRVDELSLVDSTDFTPSISASAERITFSSDRRATMDAFVATRVCP